MSNNIQITEIHNYDVDCVVDDETIRYLILKHIAEKSGVRLDLLRTYCDVKLFMSPKPLGENCESRASVMGEIPGHVELRRGSVGEAPVHGMPYLEVKMDNRALGAIERIRELARQLPDGARLEPVDDFKMMEYRQKFIRDVIYTTIRTLFPLDQPIQNMTERNVCRIADLGAHHIVTAPVTDKSKPDQQAEYDQLVETIRRVANSWKGTNGGIYTINAMSNELATVILAERHA